MARRALRANVSEDSFRRWHAYARHHGVSATGLLDAIGETLDPGMATVDLAAAIGRARQLDGERRHRD